jgi:ribosomal protein S18 acetylase RimI-like enzyme
VTEPLCIAARAFDVPTLTQLFNAGFSGYPFSMQLSEAAFGDHVALFDIDLGISQVVQDGRPSAFALVGRRGQAAWIGGMGTTPSYRRRGLGEMALVAAIEAAVAGGCTDIGLEVIDVNEPALRLYLKRGFHIVRDLAVWSLAPASRPADVVAETVQIGRAQEWIGSRRRGSEPRQRADDTLVALERRGMGPKGLVIERDGVVAAAVIREQGEAVAVLQIAAVDEDAATEILLAAAGCDRTLRLANLPIDEPVSHAMRRLGADRVATQHEMVLTAT